MKYTLEGKEIKFGLRPSPRETILKWSYQVEVEEPQSWKFILLPSVSKEDDPWGLDTYWQAGTNGCAGSAGARLFSAHFGKRFDHTWLWREAKVYDGLPDTNYGDNNGTTLLGVMMAAYKLGLKYYERSKRGNWQKKLFPSRTYSPKEWQWLVGSSLRFANSPLAVGTFWYSDMMEVHRDPKGIGWIYPGGINLGGHGYNIMEYNLELDAFGIANNWRREWQFNDLAYIPRVEYEQLYSEFGEGVVIIE